MLLLKGSDSVGRDLTKRYFFNPFSPSPPASLSLLPLSPSFLSTLPHSNPSPSPFPFQTVSPHIGKEKDRAPFLFFASISFLPLTSRLSFNLPSPYHSPPYRC